MPYSLTEGTNKRAQRGRAPLRKAEVVVRIHIRQACPTRPVGRFTDLPTHGLLQREGGENGNSQDNSKHVHRNDDVADPVLREGERQGDCRWIHVHGDAVCCAPVLRVEGMMDKIKVVLDKGAYMPERAHDLDAGYDIRTPVDVAFSRSVVIDTGVHIEIPKGYVGFLKSKSGLNVKSSLVGEGVVDAGYTGSIRVKLYKMDSTDDEVYRFYRGNKIIQLVILPIYTPQLVVVDKIWESERGSNGFGSSGV